MAPRPLQKYRTTPRANRWCPRVRLGLVLASLAEDSAWHLETGVGVRGLSRSLGLLVVSRIQISGIQNALFVYGYTASNSPNWLPRGGCSREGISCGISEEINLSSKAVLIEWNTPRSTDTTKVFLQFLSQTVSGLLAPPLDAAKNCTPFFKSTDCLSSFQKDARIQNACIKRTKMYAVLSFTI